MISDIEFSEEDKPWSVNIKKAILNMLQINVMKRGEITRQDREEELENKNFFATVERTLEGECEVEYTINDMKKEFTQWTKSINFQKCNVRPEVQYGIRPRDFKKTHDEKLFSTVFNYKVTGDRDEFLIHEVELESQYKLMPLAKNHELITSYVYNKMTLVYAGKTETHIPSVRRDRKETLIYNFDWEIAEEMFAMTGDEKYLHRIPEWKNKVEHIEKLLTLISRHIEDKVELETTHMFARLVKLLRLCREQELIKIQRFFETRENVNHKVLSLYYDALAMAGTKVTVSELVKKITEEKIDTMKAARLLKSLSEVPVPSEKIADEILRVCESDLVERAPHLKQSCWLTYGAIFNGLCNNEKLAVYHVENMCKRELKEKVVRKLMDMFRRVGTRYEKVLMLKTLGNAGIDVSVHELEKIIYDKEEEKVIRIEAIHALRKLRLMMPRKIQTILMPIYKDRTEIPEIRMTALRRIMKTMPQQIVVDQIVRMMEVERDPQLRAFTYRTLKAILEVPEVHEKTVHHVKKALRTVDTEFYENLNNRVMRWTMKNDNHRYGVSLDLHSMVTKDSVLPKELRTTLDSIFGGKWYEYFMELGLSQQNIDEILNKMLRKLQETDMEHLVVRGKRSAIYGPADFFRKIYEKLNFVRRHPNKDDAHAMIYFRYKDMDYAFLPFDEDTIPKFIKNMFRDGKVELDEIERFLATGTQFTRTGGFHIYEYVRKIPTTFGLPLKLMSKMPTVGTVQGHIKVEMKPRETEEFEGLRVRLLVKPKVATTHVVEAVVLSPVVENGFKMLHSATFDMPFDTETEITWKHKLHVKTMLRPFEHKKHVLHLQSRPVTFIRHMRKTHAYPEPVEITVHLREHLYPIKSFERTFFKRLGMIVKLTGTMHRPISRHTDTMNPILIGYNTYDVHVEPTEDLPKEYVFHMELENFVPERLEKPEIDKLLRHNDEMFNVEVEDFEPKRTVDRKTHLTTYLRNFDIEKAYKHRLLFKLETIGQREKRNAEMELKVIHDNKYRFWRTFLFVRRPPMGTETRDWEMKVEVQTVYPEIPKTLMMLKEQINRECHIMVDAMWGNEHKNTVFMRIQGEQSREQKMWMKKVDREENRLTEMEKLKMFSFLNLYKLKANYKLTPETEYYVYKLFSILKTWNLWRSEFEKVHNKEGTLRMELEIEPLNRRMFDLRIETPKEHVVMKRLTMPFRLPNVHFHSMHTLEHTEMKHLLHHLIKTNRPQCIVKSKEVNTFDNLRLKTPLTNCYTVLAKDCGNEEPRFVVLMKKIHKDREDKKLKIVTRENVYKMEMIDEKLIVKINDREITPEEFKKYHIYRVDDMLYKIDVDDVVVMFDGIEANIKLSHLYKNMQCGICGHYDGEKWNDMRRADNEETTMVEDFHRSYIAKDDECEIDETELTMKRNLRLEEDLKRDNYNYREEKEFRDRHEREYGFKEDELEREFRDKENEREYRDVEEYNEEVDMDEEEVETRKPRLRTRVIERDNHVCFSTEPYLECPEHTTKDEVNEKEVEFICHRAHHPETRRLLRKARVEVIPRHLLDGDLWTTTIRVPKMCTVY
ncbi:Lipid transport protein and Vitellinogen and von Willebrand factor domain containing protein [Trichostrongylus colubriformis]|uniref:Lipid transport protein and Vitellinogen and von Willebrand factor domain containing protein n=1 Tax=Trichostrongylus colubriformis TaxID=6319 RepID=A0AAN8ISF8_TRICO